MLSPKLRVRGAGEASPLRDSDAMQFVFYRKESPALPGRPVPKQAAPGGQGGPVPWRGHIIPKVRDRRPCPWPSATRWVSRRPGPPGAGGTQTPPVTPVAGSHPPPSRTKGAPRPSAEPWPRLAVPLSAGRAISYPSHCSARLGHDFVLLLFSLACFKRFMKTSRTETRWNNAILLYNLY